MGDAASSPLKVIAFLVMLESLIVFVSLLPQHDLLFSSRLPFANETRSAETRRESQTGGNTTRAEADWCAGSILGARGWVEFGPYGPA